MLIELVFIIKMVIKDIKYINLNGFNGKYTIYYKIDGRVYKTDYFIEV